MNYDAVPLSLRALRQWVVWRLEIPAGKDKLGKVPYEPAGMHSIDHQSSHLAHLR